MAKQTAADKFSNSAVITVTESAANTLTFKKLDTGIPLFEKVAWIIQRIEYFINDLAAGQFNASGDYMTLALTATSSVAFLALEDPAVIDLLQIRRSDFGAAANAYLEKMPWVKDFTSLPGGGLIVAPNPLYLAAKGNGLVAASSSLAKIFYTNYPLAVDEYWELVESRRIIVS